MADSLFDALEEVPDEDPVIASRLRGEVPQERFLSWPLAMQYIYCAERDEESAAAEDDPDWKAFYLARAEGYWQLAREAK